jgi:hypothetical protein
MIIIFRNRPNRQQPSFQQLRRTGSFFPIVLLSYMRRDTLALASHARRNRRIIRPAFLLGFPKWAWFGHKFSTIFSYALLGISFSSLAEF